MLRDWRGLAVFCAAIAMVALQGCGRGAVLPPRILALSNQPSITCLKVGLPVDPGELNPILHLEEGGCLISRMIHAGPLRRMPGGAFGPDLWSDWKTEKNPEGNLVVEGTWKENLFWHDGKPFTPKDFEFTLAAIKVPENFSPYARLAEMITSVDRLDNGKKMRITFRGSSRRNLEILAVGLLPSHLLEGKKLDQVLVEVASGAIIPASASGTPLFADWPIGLGQFKISGRRERRFLELDLASPPIAETASSVPATDGQYPKSSRDETLLEGVPATDGQYPKSSRDGTLLEGVPATDGALLKGINKILVRFYYRPEDLVGDLRGGRLDWLQVPSEYAGKIEELKIPGVRFQPFRNPSCLMLGFNLKKAPGNRVEFRRAVNLALDRKKMKDLIPYEGRLLNGPPTASGVPENMLVPQISEANALLEKAGFRDTDGDGLREDGGKPLQVELLINQENPLRKSLAESLVRDLQKIGVKGNIVSVTWSDFTEKRLNTGQFDLFLSSFQVPENGNWIDLWGTPAGESASGPRDFSGNVNFTGFSDAGMDEALKALDEYPDVANRSGFREKVNGILLDQVPACYLFIPHDVAAIADSIHHFPTNGEIWDLPFDTIEKPVAAKSGSQG